MAFVKKYDMIVVGAGSAGASTAYHLASSGYDVALLEKKSMEQAGAKWVNDIAPWMFDMAKLPRPESPEKRDDFKPFTMMSQNHQKRIQLPKRPLWGVDMRKLTKRLQSMALNAGVTPYDHVEIIDLIFQGNRPSEIKISISDSLSHKVFHTLKADLFIDATGMKGELRQLMPAAKKLWPTIQPFDTCSAAQQVCFISDRSGAQAFLNKLNIPEDHFICFTGVQGGFSTKMFYIDEGFETVSILTGVLWDGHHGTGLDLINQIKADHSWIGPIDFGGSGLIPIRRPFDQLGIEGIALIGDAACQVFPAHGSGVGNGLIASYLLKESIQPFHDPGSQEAIDAYQQAFHRYRGAYCAAYEIFSRMSRDMSENDIYQMIHNGWLSSTSVHACLDQLLPSLSIKDTMQAIQSFIQSPFMGMMLLSNLLKMVMSYGLYSLYPKHSQSIFFNMWSQCARIASQDKFWYSSKKSS